MEITKRDALELLKVLDRAGVNEQFLHPLGGSVAASAAIRLSRERSHLSDFNARLEAFILDENHGDVRPAGFEFDDGRHDPDYGDEGLSYEGEIDDDLKPFVELDPEVLKSLKSTKGLIIASSVGDPDDKVELEFNVEKDIVDLWINKGELVIGPLTRVERRGNNLLVAEQNSGEQVWHEFETKKMPKAWIDALEDGTTLSVPEERHPFAAGRDR